MNVLTISFNFIFALPSAQPYFTSSIADKTINTTNQNEEIELAQLNIGLDVHQIGLKFGQVQ